MPIRFRCKRCHQVLGITSRKAGSAIECPKCGFGQIVPSEEAAAAAMALSGRSNGPPVIDADDDLTVYDDAPEPVEVVAKRQPLTAPSSAPVPPVAPPPVGASREANSSAGRVSAVPGGMILLPRRALFVQGWLVVCLAIVFFGAGYFIGRGTAKLELILEHEAAIKERTLIEGQLVYRPEPLRVAGDENAVVVALPANTAPQSPIAIHGIRPQDPQPPESLHSLRLLHELGAAYARTDAEGRFDMIVPDQGEYYVLIISRNAGRPPGTDPDEADLLEIGRYFTMPERLISRFKYRWARSAIHGGLPPIEIDFGEDGRDD